MIGVLDDLQRKTILTSFKLDEKININHSQLARFESGKSELTLHHIEVLTSFFNVSAGTTKEMKDYYLGLLQEKVGVIHDYFYLDVNGNSTSPTFEDEDYGLVKFQRTAENNALVIALPNGLEATMKRYKKIGQEQFLFADNTKYDPIKLSEELNPYIVGVVEGYFRPRIK